MKIVTTQPHLTSTRLALVIFYSFLERKMRHQPNEYDAVNKVGKRRLIVVATGLGAIAAIAGVVFTMVPMSVAATNVPGATEVAAVPVTVATVISEDLSDWNDFSGRLEAIDRVQIRSRVAGAIQSAEFREGSLVKQGDILFTIDPTPYEVSVAQAQAQVGSAAAKVSLAQTELDRGRKLSDNRTISQSDLDQRQSALVEAQAVLRSAQAALQATQLDLGYTQVRAPVSGRIGKIEVTPGNLVAAGSASPELTTLVSVDPIYASFNASEEIVTRALAELPTDRDVSRTVDQIPFEIGVLSGKGTSIKGKIQLVDNNVDAASGTIAVRAVFDNPGGKLFPGQFVRVRMGAPKSKNQIVVSDRAIGTDQDKNFVFVVDSENKVTYRSVQLGSVVGDLRIVKSGLNAGEKIVVNGLQRLRPGTVISPQAEKNVAATD